MPKLVDYPRASLKYCSELATAVDSLGGKCSVQSAADFMKLKISGSFDALVSSTVKYGLIENKGGQLTITQLYKNIKLSYDDDERLSFERESFFSMVLFKTLYERFRSKELPVSMLSKLLIRELDVKENIATRVKNIFIEGLKQVKLLDQANYVLNLENSQDEKLTDVQVIEENAIINNKSEDLNDKEVQTIELQDSSTFSFHIVGPGVNSRIAIIDVEDFEILESYIKKIKRRFEENIKR